MPEPAARRGYESITLRVWPFATFLICFILSAALFHVLLYYLQAYWLKDATAVYPPAAVAPAPPPPEPRLQPSPDHPTNPWEDRPALRAAPEKRINVYGPLPAEPGYARIPIHRAMQLLATEPPK